MYVIEKNELFYVRPDAWSQYIEDARLFHSYDTAFAIARLYGARVLKFMRG